LCFDTEKKYLTGAMIAILAQQLHKLFNGSQRHPLPLQRRIWLGLSLIVPILYSVIGLQRAFNAQYVIQDDARQHLFWMQQFVDPNLFPNDVIADYFRTIQPVGVVGLYQIMAKLGVDPFWLAKVLPPMVGLAVAYYCFQVCLELLPIPIAGFIASLLLSQRLWMSDDLFSSTSRTFLYPLGLAVCYYWLRRSWVGFISAISLLTLFYPPFALVLAGTVFLQLGQWNGKQLSLTSERQPWGLVGIGITIVVITTLLQSSSTAAFGPTITATEAMKMPEFQVGGRTSFFEGNTWSYWFLGGRSGLRLAFTPPLIGIGLLLPILQRYPQRFPLVQQVTSGVTVLWHLLLTSLGLFFLAHAVLFKLYLPSRYTVHSFRIVLALATGIALTILLDALVQWGNQAGRRFVLLGIISCLAVILLSYPVVWGKAFPRTKYVTGPFPQLYAFLQQQPNDSLVASLSAEVNNLPSFAQRSILVGREYAIPFHVGYYHQFQQRVVDLIQAQYSPDLETVKQFIQTYGVDFWLLDRDAFTPNYLIKNRWFQQFQPETNQATLRLQHGVEPALARTINACTVFDDPGLILLKGNCIIAQ
jgi:hypothetical protein